MHKTPFLWYIESTPEIEGDYGMKEGMKKEMKKVTQQNNSVWLSELTQLTLQQAAMITGGNTTPTPEEPKQPTSAPSSSSTSTNSQEPTFPGGNQGRPPFN